jgi:stage IV sporulation protein FB
VEWKDPYGYLADDEARPPRRARPAARLARWLNASLPLFPIGAISVRLHWSFLLFAVIFAAWSARAGAGGASLPVLFAWGLVQAAILYSLVLLHELGHAAAAILKGGSCSRIVLTPLGGLASVGGVMKSPAYEAESSLAGPGVNLVILAVSMVHVSFFGLPTGWWVPFTAAGAFAFLFWANVVLGVFNVVPAFPMDGGRVLRAFLTWRRGPRRGTLAACRAGQVLAFAFVGIGVWRAWLGGFGGWVLIGIGIANLLACTATLRTLALGLPVYEEYVPERRVLRLSRRERLELRRRRKEAETERRLDKLLDKVSREGMRSLSLRERLFLRRASRRYREKSEN